MKLDLENDLAGRSFRLLGPSLLTGKAEPAWLIRPENGTSPFSAVAQGYAASLLPILGLRPLVVANFRIVRLMLPDELLLFLSDFLI